MAIAKFEDMLYEETSGTATVTLDRRQRLFSRRTRQRWISTSRANNG